MSVQLPNAGHPCRNIELLINKLLRITIKDERYYIGRFTCTDSDLNIVLFDAEEFLPHPKTPSEKAERRTRDMWYPKSQRGSHEGPGWGRYAKTPPEGEEIDTNVQGRMLGAVLLPGRLVVSVELLEEIGRGLDHIGGGGMIMW